MAIDLIWLNKCRYLKGLQGEKSNATLATLTIKKHYRYENYFITYVRTLCIFPRTLKSWRHQLTCVFRELTSTY